MENDDDFVTSQSSKPNLIQSLWKDSRPKLKETLCQNFVSVTAVKVVSTEEIGGATINAINQLIA